jgi:hypothetical protein
MSTLLNVLPDERVPVAIEQIRCDETPQTRVKVRTVVVRPTLPLLQDLRRSRLDHPRRL